MSRKLQSHSQTLWKYDQIGSRHGQNIVLKKTHSIPDFSILGQQNRKTKSFLYNFYGYRLPKLNGICLKCSLLVLIHILTDVQFVDIWEGRVWHLTFHLIYQLITNNFPSLLNYECIFLKKSGRKGLPKCFQVHLLAFMNILLPQIQLHTQPMMMIAVAICNKPTNRPKNVAQIFWPDVQWSVSAQQKIHRVATIVPGRKRTGDTVHSIEYVGPVKQGLPQRKDSWGHTLWNA